MKILNSNNNSIAYHSHVVSKRKAPCLIFHHGFMSNMNGDKALSIESYCKTRDYNFIRYDSYGSGASSGEFTDQTISSWLDGLILVIEELAADPVILVGSSLGGWISILAGMKLLEKIAGIITISAAFDFTEEVIWNSFDHETQNKFKKEGILDVIGADPLCIKKYPISYNLIEDARQHLLLNREEIDVICPVHLIHGMKDTDIPHSLSVKVAEKLISDNVVVKLIKEGSHNLSREQDLDVIYRSIEEIVGDIVF